MDTPRSTTPRSDGRADDALRPITITRHWLDHAAGSVLVEFGTHPGAVCRLGVRGRARAGARAPVSGWVTAEYAMLPASTNTRSDRESVARPDRRPHPRDLAG